MMRPATGERSFSTLKLLKTYLRSTMSDSRLNGLAMMHMSQLQLFCTINEKQMTVILEKI